MKKNRQPIMLDAYLKWRAKRNRLLRSLCAAGLLLAAILLRLLVPDSARTVRAWIFGDGRLNGAVAAFYTCAEDGKPLAEAVEALCIALDGD